VSRLIHPTAIVEDGAQIGQRVEIGAYCHIGGNVSLGDDCRIHPHAIVMGDTSLDNTCAVHSHAVLGGQAQVLGDLGDGPQKLEIGPRGVFREHVTVHTGVPKSGGLTRIGSDCFMMVGSHIGHDGKFGDNVVIANAVAIAGHVTAGDHVWFGGAAAVHQNVRIGRNAFIGGGAILVEDVIPFGSVIGNRAKLAGLNVVGLKRRGFTKADIQQIRRAYKAVFEADKTFAENLSAAATEFADQPLAMEVIDFIGASGSRTLCKP
jgi:UDP-N-acetylglucosamine acyltransferase